MKRKRVLFICVNNSARSQMAEEFLRQEAPDQFEVESAGMEPTVVNPLVVEAMAEEGIDISTKKTRSVFDLFKQGKLYHFVITVCDESLEGRCPVFPGVTHRMHLPFPDPGKVVGGEEKQLEHVREIRDSIRSGISEFVFWAAGTTEAQPGESQGVAEKVS